MTAPSVKPRTAEVVIYQGDDLAQIADLRSAVARAENNQGGGSVPVREGERTALQEAAAAYDAFVAKAAKRAVIVTLQQLGRRRWRELRNANPPRKDNESDAALGFDEDGLSDALVPESVVAPDFGSQAARDEFLDSLADGDWQKMFTIAYQLNAAAGVDPKAVSMRSYVDRMSNET